MTERPEPRAPRSRRLRAASISAGSVDGQGRDDHARPARAQEPAHLRLLRRAARHVPRAGATPTTSRRVVITGAGGNFCSGGDVHEIIGPLDPHDDAGAAGLHADDRRSRQGDARLPAADHRGGRRRLRRRRRDPRDGVRPALRHRRGQGRVPVHPRRARRLRHGRLRDPAAHHRPGPRRRAALHRPRDDGEEGRALGLLQRARPRRTTCSPSARRWRSGSPTARPSRTPSPRRCCTANGRWISTPRSRPRRRRRRSAWQTDDFRRAYEAFAAKRTPVFEGN